MANVFDEIRIKLNEADNANRAVDANVLEMARLIKGRLRSASAGKAFWELGALASLKKELRGFNLTTGRWK